MKYYIWTEGCQMNSADSDRLARSFDRLGLCPSADINEADLIVLNTCMVRQSAEDKALGRLNSLKPLKQANPQLIIGLMGCMVGIHGNPALQKRFPWVDVFAPPSDPAPFLEILREPLDAEEALSWRTQIDNALDEEFKISSESSLFRVSENLPIVLGCSHACAYCIIPQKRGGEKSRSSARILAEAQNLAQHGVKEVVLLGQIVDRYGLDLTGEMHLPQLLEELSAIDGLLRIRFLTSHPNWMSDELIQTVARLPKVMPHIEVPAQAGNDAVLKAMRRGYTNAQYRELITRIRSQIPGVSIGTDIIVGFPGESESAFDESYQLLADLKLDVAHLARYSPRPGTWSANKMPDDVSPEEKMRRFRLLEDLQKEVVGTINQQYLGQDLPILFEEKVKGRWRGRSQTNRLVHINSDEALQGQERLVHISWTGPWTLTGDLLPQN